MTHLFPPAITFDAVLFLTAILLLLSVVASKVSDKFGIPALLLFLILGMLVGSEGPGGIYFDNPSLAKSLGIVALIVILFSGGLATAWEDIRPVLRAGVLLSIVGVFLTAVVVGWFAVYALNFSLLEGFLLGAIISSTDAAAVFSILKSKNIRLPGRLQSLLELESGSNDPMAVFLTLGAIRLITNSQAKIVDLLPAFVLEFAIGALTGYLFSRLMIFFINRLNLAYEGLYPVLMIALTFLCYSTTTALKGNGFLAVYLAGLLVGNANFVHKKSLLHFHEGLAWLMQIAMFLTLGLLVFPSRLIPVIGTGLLASLFLMFVARPLSVWVCLLPFRMPFNDKTMLAWVGLRGAVPIILATFPLIAHLPKAEMIFNIVFFIVLTSVLLQGTTIPFVSKLLKAYEPLRTKRTYPLELASTAELDANLEDVIIPYNSWVVGKALFRIRIPPGCLVVLISRDDRFLIPNGATILEEADVLLVLANNQDLKTLQALIQKPSPSLERD